MRIVFLGAGAFGLPTLQALASSTDHQVVGVVSQPDKPAGRGGTLTPTPIAEWAAANLPSVPLIKSPKISAGDDAARVRAIDGEAWLVIAFGQKLSAELLAGKRAINLHASLLPRWRGAAPINAAILAGDRETGNSIITLADRMDAGLVLAQSRPPRTIDPSITAGELHDQLSADGPALCLSVLAELDGHLARAAVSGMQDEARTCRAPKLGRSDGWVEFAHPAEQCRNRIHGLTPWPGVFAKVARQDVKLLRAIVETGCTSSQSQPPPGTLIDPSTGLIACGTGTALRILTVQPAGKKAMPWSDFARGRRLEAGAVVTSEKPVC